MTNGKKAPLVSFCLVILLCHLANSEESARSSRRPSKRSSNPKYNQLYDQLAQESEPVGGALARNPRADSNHGRSYVYRPGGAEGPPSGWGDARQLSSFNLGNFQSAVSSMMQPGQGDYAFGESFPVEDNSVAAGGHGHQSYGHGWGWGHGGGHGHGHGKGCNSALGLLGVLGLASYLQSVLRQMNMAGAGGGAGGGGGGAGGGGAGGGGGGVGVGRRRRDVPQLPGGDDIVSSLMPLLAALSRTKDGRAPIKCAMRPYCVAHQILRQRLGVMGAPVCDQLRKVVESFVDTSSGQSRALRDLRKAAKVGAKGGSCMKLYPKC